jgi:hypothetical protein
MCIFLRIHWDHSVNDTVTSASVKSFQGHVSSVINVYGVKVIYNLS